MMHEKLAASFILGRQRESKFMQFCSNFMLERSSLMFRCQWIFFALG